MSNRVKSSSIADLQIVFDGHVVYRKFTEFLCQTETLANIFRWDKIKPDLDAWLQKDDACIDINTKML
jgi:hypothetical protein